MNQIGILALDIGTTNLKCGFFDQNLKCLKFSIEKLDILHPEENFNELDSEALYNSIKKVVNQTICDFRESHKIKCFGLSTQRNSVILWNKKTGKPYCNFILWSDRRNTNLNELNSRLSIIAIKKATSLATHIVSNERFKAASKYRIDPNHVTPKLLSQLKILENKLESGEYKEILYGTIETWLIWRITQEKKFLTEISCACCTGFYDIFKNCWSSIICNLFHIPMTILPKVCDTCFNYGTLDKEFVDLDYEIPFTAVIADSQSSLIAECAFNKGDCVICLGTGSFISVNVGNKPLASNNVAYPVACFKKDDDKIYILHSVGCSTGISVDWAKSIGLFNDYNELEDILKSVKNSNGVYFVPAFGVLDLPNVNKETVSPGFIGLKANTSKAEMIRAIFDSLAFTIKIKMDLILSDLAHHNIPLRSIRVNGGVSRSNFFCQYLSNLLNFNIERTLFSNSSSIYGAAYLSAYSSNLFADLEDIRKLNNQVETFKPLEDNNYFSNFSIDLENWKRSLNHFNNWFKKSDN